MEARFDIGEVLLTVSILEVLRQFVIRVMPRNLPLTDRISKYVAGDSC